MREHNPHDPAELSPGRMLSNLSGLKNRWAISIESCLPWVHLLSPFQCLVPLSLLVELGGCLVETLFQILFCVPHRLDPAFEQNVFLLQTNNLGIDRRPITFACGRSNGGSS